MDMDAFMAFVGKFAGDLGAVVAAGNVVVGDRLGLYRALADSGPATAAEGRRRPVVKGHPMSVGDWLRRLFPAMSPPEPEPIAPPIPNPLIRPESKS